MDAYSLNAILIIHRKEPNRRVDLVDKRGNSHTARSWSRGLVQSAGGSFTAISERSQPNGWSGASRPLQYGSPGWENSGIGVRDGSCRSGRGAVAMQSQTQKWLVAGIASLGLSSTSVAFGQASEQGVPSNASPSQPNLQPIPKVSESTPSYPRGWAAFPQGKQPLEGMGASPSPQYGSLATPQGVISQGAPGYVPGPSGQLGAPGAGIYGLVPGQPGQAPTGAAPGTLALGELGPGAGLGGHGDGSRRCTRWSGCRCSHGRSGCRCWRGCTRWSGCRCSHGRSGCRCWRGGTAGRGPCRPWWRGRSRRGRVRAAVHDR